MSTHHLKVFVILALATMLRTAQAKFVTSVQGLAAIIFEHWSSDIPPRKTMTEDEANTGLDMGVDIPMSLEEAKFIFKTLRDAASTDQFPIGCQVNEYPTSLSFDYFYTGNKRHLDSGFEGHCFSASGTIYVAVGKVGATKWMLGRSYHGQEYSKKEYRSVTVGGYYYVGTLELAVDLGGSSSRS